MKLGLDIGSTTIKCVLLDEENKIIYKTYKRHFSKIQETTITLLETVKNLIDSPSINISLTGSAGMGMANRLDIPFIQEVYATRTSILEFNKDTDVVIELGGEDAKILFLQGTLEVRMNGTCAGGTGSFIDQMATLLDLETESLNDIAKRASISYPIASRCGVFAKGDIQPLINQGAKKADIVLSIYQAVVNQTISGLAQGRQIKGNVVYLGGPLTFMSVLRDCFDKTLDTKGVCPENSLYYVALGTALGANEEFDINSVITLLKTSNVIGSYNSLPALFETDLDLHTFRERHSKASLSYKDPKNYNGNAYLGIDSGSTTIKMVIVDEDNNLLHTRYQSNKGNPVEAVREFLTTFKSQYPNINLKKGCSTGYGEVLIKKAFNLEYSLVETMAHYKAAKYFDKDTDFIIDIGGQDIKCFKIVDGVIDDIFLNEACSSGCGSFLQTFFQALGYSTEEASKLALTSKHPVDLGSRCTVFMNSSVKQAQKDGAQIEDIFAGLAISVVKNALYKVIRTNTGLGQHIVVQGGTFLNDAVLRAFEMELNLNVTRCKEAGLMGAFGCALYAKQEDNNDEIETSILTLDQLANFTHNTSTRICKGCTNHCQLTINKFDNNRVLISGNKCERFTNPDNFVEDSETLNIFKYKQNYINNLKPIKGPRGKIGIPLALSIIELAPLYYTLFTELGYEVIISPFSKRDTYLKGQSQVPSDTICYPAKLVHGHVIDLIEKDVKKIFFPNSSFNIDEKKSDNNYNCPVVAYYGEVISKNTPQLDENNVTFINEYLSVANKKVFKKRLNIILNKYDKFSKKEISKAANKAFDAQEKYNNDVILKGKEIVELARSTNKEIMVLCGRPYHIDPEVNHGIDELMLQLGCAVISEDSLASFIDKKQFNVLNQWTYHNRMYLAAHYVNTTKDMNIVQLVSFGCGLDAVTADEVKDILKQKNKIYTQLKIDEIANLGSVRIRLRSLLAALKEENNG
ncbi:MAG: acyl-CoA dehydratase activase [Pleomorphochaeta sp.]